MSFEIVQTYLPPSKIKYRTVLLCTPNTSENHFLIYSAMDYFTYFWVPYKWNKIMSKYS